MPIFPVIQLRGPRSCHLLRCREGRGSAGSEGSGFFPGWEQEETVLQLADLVSVPIAFIFLKTFIAPFEGGLGGVGSTLTN